MSNNHESLQDLLRKLQGVKLPKETEDVKQISSNMMMQKLNTKVPGTVPVHNIELFQLSFLQVFTKIRSEIASCTDDGPKFQELCRLANEAGRMLSMVHGLTAIAVHMLQKASENLRIPVNNIDSRAHINKETFDGMWSSVKELLGDDTLGTDEQREFVWNALNMSASVNKLDSVTEAVQKAQDAGASVEELKDILNSKVNEAINDDSTMPEAQKDNIREVINKLLNK